MKMQTLFDLLEAAQDVLALFDNVETEAQLVSRLERLKRIDVEGMLEDLDALRVATSNALEANLELGGALGDTEQEFNISSLGDMLGEEDTGKTTDGDEAEVNPTPDTALPDSSTNQEKPDTTT